MMGAAVICCKSMPAGRDRTCNSPCSAKGSECNAISISESLISMDISEKSFTSPPELTKYSAIGAGPGIGMSKETQSALKNLLENVKILLYSM